MNLSDLKEVWQLAADRTGLHGMALLEFILS